MPESRFKKYIIIIIPIVTMVQALVYLKIAFSTLKKDKCAVLKSDLSNIQEFAMNLIYFSDKNCTPPTIHIPDQGLDVQLQINHSVAEVISNREFTILVWYAEISVMWFLTSYFVLVIICVHPPKILVAIFFGLWFLCIAIGSILDAIATWFHVNDMIHTTTVEKTFEYVGVEYNAKVVEYLSAYDPIFQSAAVRFTCYSTRVCFFWLLNVFGSVFCLYLSTKLSANTQPQIESEDRQRPNIQRQKY